VPKYPTTLVAVLAAVGGLALPSAALATSGTATITGDTITMAEPSNVDFNTTMLNGTDQTVDSSQTIAMSDRRGSGAGWNITGSATQFTTLDGKTLPSSAVTIPTAPTVACVTGATGCAKATTDIPYAYTLDQNPKKLFNATPGTGLGNQTLAVPFRLAIPASTTAGQYTSTWTYTLAGTP
jgi:hypothetical protein